MGHPLPDLHGGPVSGVGDNRPLGRPLGTQRVDLLEGDLPLGLESDLGGNAGTLPSSTIGGPPLRRVEAVGGRNAYRFANEAERQSHLAVVLLAEVSAILTRYADGVGFLIGDPGVVERPRHHSAVAIHLVEHGTVGDAEEGPVLPGSRRHEMVEGLEARRHALGIHAGRQRADAFALSGKSEAHEVGPQGIVPILVSHGKGELLQVVVELAILEGREGGYASRKGKLGCAVYDIVELASTSRP